MKITMNVNDELLARVDAFAKANYQTRTGVFCFAVSQFLTAQQLPAVMTSIEASFRKIAETGEMDEESKRVLEELHVFAEALRNGK